MRSDQTVSGVFNVVAVNIGGGGGVDSDEELMTLIILQSLHRLRLDLLQLGCSQSRTSSLANLWLQSKLLYYSNPVKHLVYECLYVYNSQVEPFPLRTIIHITSKQAATR